MKCSDAKILLFCKAPIEGTVKTRLIPALGGRGSCRLHQKLASRVIREVELSNICSLQIWCYPATSHVFFQAVPQLASTSLMRQEGSDLGERMYYAAASALAEPGVNRVLLIGTDTPNIDAAYLMSALQALEHHDAVIGPAEDGGYVLLGIKAAERMLFEGVRWSTSQVFSQTCQRLENLDYNWSELAVQWDVDEPEDLKRLPSSYLENL